MVSVNKPVGFREFPLVESQSEEEPCGLETHKINSAKQVNELSAPSH